MINYNYELTQGTDEWLATRLGKLTASEMKHIVTPTLKPASNDKERTHLYELLSQRISGYIEPAYVSDDMLRGRDDEVDALEIYAESYDEVTPVGFVENDKWGFTLGYSPDALVGNDGLVEVKSRKQKYQVQTIIDQEMPKDYLIQVQTGLLVSERSWCDFISYCGGMPMVTIRVYPDEFIQAAIIQAATIFHQKLDEKLAQYQANINNNQLRMVETERRVEQEITV